MGKLANMDHLDNIDYLDDMENLDDIDDMDDLDDMKDMFTGRYMAFSDCFKARIYTEWPKKFPKNNVVAK